MGQESKLMQRAFCLPAFDLWQGSANVCQPGHCLPSVSQTCRLHRMGIWDLWVTALSITGVRSRGKGDERADYAEHPSSIFRGLCSHAGGHSNLISKVLPLLESQLGSKADSGIFGPRTPNRDQPDMGSCPYLPSA